MGCVVIETRVSSVEIWGSEDHDGGFWDLAVGILAGCVMPARDAAPLARPAEESRTEMETMEGLNATVGRYFAAKYV